MTLLQVPLESADIALGRERVLRVLANLALGFLEPGAEPRDVVDRPLELPDDDVRPRVGLGADLVTDARRRGEARRAIVLMERPRERRADERAAREPG